MANGLPPPEARGSDRPLAPTTAQEDPAEIGSEATGTDAHHKQAKKSNGRKTKAAIVVGSLNLNGKGSLAANASKWGAVNQLLREGKIGVLALQETHLSDDDLATIKTLYGRRLCVFNSPDPDNPTATRGVAIVLNRELMDTSSVHTKEVVPGRALLVTTNWHAGRTITILNVYAPNDVSQNTAFWTTLGKAFAGDNLRKPDIMTGDFNLVEEAIDRIPAKDSPDKPLSALRDLLTSLRLHDGWRLTNPTDREYTWPQRGGGQRSRIDRIYASDDIIKRSFGWNITTSGVPTDHCLTTAHLTAAQSPRIGKGRWTMPPQLLLDAVFLWQVAAVGKRELVAAKACAEGTARTESANPQLALRRFKQQTKELARKRLKQRVPRIKVEIAQMSERKAAIQNRPDFADDPIAQEEASSLQEHIAALEAKRHGMIQLATTTHYNLNAEATSRS
ncbi:hypothetical protein FOMPIDRAFT_1033460 [Fomitopsis schrenkii]|uniref:Endonuclease/exonuclease/phosphatase domain-containing protein n=1 Tax=Fomitopsis schrenkii TaxID=2126942 RepID=S8DNP5_FOMSC|nr:hypothetical protein FOMPIDRAFT_1033460 [Fomitopsis schrenkii]